jgi:hypothetical protein
LLFQHHALFAFEFQPERAAPLERNNQIREDPRK